MQLFGLISILLSVLLGVWWFFGTQSAPSGALQQETRVNYSDAIDAARAVPGAPQ